MMVSTLGTTAVAAVGLSNQPRLIGLSVIISLNVGVMSVVARYKGSKDQNGANRCLKASLALSVLVSLAMLLVLYLGCEPILWFGGAQSDTISGASQYFRIIAFGNFFHCIGLTITAAQRGIGNTRISMYTNVTANLVNIILNYLLIEGHLGFPRLEITGAALATAIGNFVSLAMALFSVARPGRYLFLFQKQPFDISPLRGVISISGSVVVERLCQRMGMLFFVKTVAGLGTTAFATYSICQRFVNMSFSVGDGLSVAASALVAQSLGAASLEDARRYGKIGRMVALQAAGVLAGIYVVFSRPIMSFFSNDPAVLSDGAVGIVMIAVMCLAHIPQVVMAGCLRGAGDTAFVAKVTLLNTMLLRPVAAWLFCNGMGWGLFGAWLSLNLDCYLRLALTRWRFSGTEWARMGVL